MANIVLDATGLRCPEPVLKIAAKSAVFKSVKAGKTVAGIPAVDAASWRRQQAIAAKLVELRRKVIALEKRMASLTDSEDERE